MICYCGSACNRKILPGMPFVSITGMYLDRTRMNRAVLTLLVCLQMASMNCAGSTGVRPMLAKGQWSDACTMIHPPNGTTSTKVSDIDAPTFDGLVAEHIGLRIGVLMVPRHVADHIVGGRSRTRPLLGHPHDVYGADWLNSSKGHRFTSDNTLFLWRVEAKGPFSATLEAPTFMGRSWEPPSREIRFADTKSILNAFGFFYDPNACNNHGSTEGTEVCLPIPQHTPTSEELAIVEEFGPRVMHRCAEGTMACTKYGFVNRVADEPDLEAMVLHLTIPMSSTCAASTPIRIALPPTSLRGSEEPLRALFPRGPRPPKELAARPPPPAVSAKPKTKPAENPSCKNSEDCTVHARCHAHASGCWIGSSDDCRASKLCREEGWCSMAPGKKAVGDVFEDSLCVAKNDTDCADSEACRVGGFCHAEANLCVAKSADDCIASVACKRFGLCTFKNGACHAASDADCMQSSLCTDWHACHAENGLCR